MESLPLISPNEAIEMIVAGKQLLDVRSEVEFERNALPFTANLPLLRTNEREQVGVCYKREGQERAIELGHKLVIGKTKEIRVGDWIRSIRQDEVSALFCARGGLRSKISQEWISNAGATIPRVSGGHKALRRTLQSVLCAPHLPQLLVVTGRTGSGKTELIKAVEERHQTIDLEGLANHRGSAFGQHASGQPQQATFENMLSIGLLKLQQKRSTRVVIEDESRKIGHRILPKEFFEHLSASPLVVLESSLEERAARICREYIEEELTCGQYADDKSQGYSALQQYFEHALEQIGKRLGGERKKECQKMLLSSFNGGFEAYEIERHLPWISFLLENYYDPFYDRHMERNSERVVFRGGMEAIVSALPELTAVDS